MAADIVDASLENERSRADRLVLKRPRAPVEIRRIGRQEEPALLRCFSASGRAARRSGETSRGQSPRSGVDRPWVHASRRSSSPPVRRAVAAHTVSTPRPARRPIGRFGRSWWSGWRVRQSLVRSVGCVPLQRARPGCGPRMVRDLSRRDSSVRSTRSQSLNVWYQAPVLDALCGSCGF